MALQRQDSPDDRWHCDNTSTFVWRRPLSPPPSRPAQGHDAESSSARSSPSEPKECAAGAASAGAAPATDSTAQSRASRDSAVMVSTGSQLVGHDSSSALSEASSSVKLPAMPSSDSLPTEIRPGLFPDCDLGQHSGACQGAQSGAEPGYREGGNAQQAPWPPDTASPRKASSSQTWLQSGGGILALFRSPIPTFWGRLCGLSTSLAVCLH